MKHLNQKTIQELTEEEVNFILDDYRQKTKANRDLYENTEMLSDFVGKHTYFGKISRNTATASNSSEEYSNAMCDFFDRYLS